VQIGFPADLSMLAITLTAPPHCSQVSISIPKTRLNLCTQVIDWCFSYPDYRMLLSQLVKLTVLTNANKKPEYMSA
jgi:hypothetical protein